MKICLKQSDYLLATRFSLNAVGTGNAGDVACSPSKLLGANLVRFGEIWKNLGKMWAKFEKI